MDLSMFGLWQDWERAFQYFDDGDPSKIATLLRSGSEVPDYRRSDLADIIEGKRRPGRGKGRLLLTYDARFAIRRAQITYHIMTLAVESGAMTAKELAGSKSEYRETLRRIRTETIQSLANDLDLSVSAVERGWREQIKDAQKDAAKEL